MGLIFVKNVIMNVITKITKFPYLSERPITTNLTFVTSAFIIGISASPANILKHLTSAIEEDGLLRLINQRLECSF